MIKIYEKMVIVNKQMLIKIIMFHENLQAILYIIFILFPALKTVERRLKYPVSPPTLTNCFYASSLLSAKACSIINLAMNSKHVKKSPPPDDLERAERLKEVLEALCEVNKRFPVIVEGKKDAQALKKLGLVGEIIPLHGGKGLYDFSEELADQFSKVVLLLDWDTKGETLFRSLRNNLPGHWEEFSAFRELLKMICQKDIKDIESIPTLLMRLEGL
jgi:5S rRNA maturation endonuclease (ribonuclease M5)